MSRLDDLKAAFRACRKTFPWGDFELLLRLLGYELKSSGSGSGRKYYNVQINDLIMLHEPHGKDMEPGMVKRLKKQLLNRGLL
jgi:hypothetical protein